MERHHSGPLYAYGFMMIIKAFPATYTNNRRFAMQAIEFDDHSELVIEDEELSEYVHYKIRRFVEFAAACAEANELIIDKEEKR